MKSKKISIIGLKIIFLTISLFVIYSIASMISGLGNPEQIQGESAGIMAVLFFVLFFQAVVISYPIIKSRWKGWKLVLTIFFVYFGIMTFMSQIETVVFLNYLVDVIPHEVIPRLFIQGIIVAGLFSPMAVAVHGKFRDGGEVQSRKELKISSMEFLGKLILISMIYIIIYFSFGRFVFMPLAGESFHEYYSGLQLPVWILPFQFIRGILWALIAIPVIRMMNGEWRNSGLAVSLLFSVLMGFLLLLPNPYMPDSIRMAHFVEVTSSNFVFGWIVVLLLHRHHSGLGICSDFHETSRI